MAVSLPVMVSMSAGDEAKVVEGPCVLTDLIAAELSGGVPASAVITGANDAVSLVAISLPAGGSWAWHGELVCGAGICVTASRGDIAVTIGYY